MPKNVKVKGIFSDRFIDKNIVEELKNGRKIKNVYRYADYERHILFCKTKAMCLITSV